ncbi:energy transducer TonB [Pleionea sediminis]|uniref:energy transducer TonB n=1 Tax=Pleionea sediminis TaxID=2569479 RepID=UPI0013DDAF21|nr:energy transducer TonB [Pleionea sediminis]
MEYPDFYSELIDRKIDGCVKVSYIIDSDGNVVNPEVEWIYPQSKRFSKSAIQAIKKWKFKPTSFNKSRKAVHSETVFSVSMFSSYKKEEVDKLFSGNSTVSHKPKERCYERATPPK